MIAKLNEKFENLGQKKFFLMASITIILSDISYMIFINSHLFSKYLSEVFIKQAIYRVNPEVLTMVDISAYRYLLINSINLAFILFLTYQIIVMFFFNKKKLWTIRYLSSYTLITAIGTAIEIPALIINPSSWIILNIIVLFVYLFNFLGIRHFKKTLEEQI